MITNSESETHMAGKERFLRRCAGNLRFMLYIAIWRGLGLGLGLDESRK